MTKKYLKSVEAFNIKEKEVDGLKRRCNELEESFNCVAVKFKCIQQELERSETRVGMALCLLDESHAANTKLEKKCSFVDVPETVHSIIKSRSKNSNDSSALEKSEMPSFELQITQTQ